MIISEKKVTALFNKAITIEKSKKVLYDFSWLIH